MLLQARKGLSKLGLVSVLFALLLAAFSMSLIFGQYSISFSYVLAALFNYDPTSIEHVILATTRLSRALVAVSVGAALSVAGVLMQTLTRNSLASPSIFGVNAGAIFCIVLCSQVFAIESMSLFFWSAFLGAAVAGGLVYGLGSVGRDGISPVRIVLAGAAISALFISFTQGILVLGQEGLDSVLFWVAGSVSGRELSVVLPVLPYLCVAIITVILFAPHINILLSGDDIATGLGQNTFVLKAALSVLIIGLAGTSVALAGNIGFVGLIVPHMARSMVGSDHRWLIPVSAVLGATLLLLADVFGRFLLAPEEIPIGVMTALVGAPFFVYLARRNNQSG